MKGIRLVRLLDVLPVNAARNAPGVSPRSLIVSCENLRAVDQVLLNGIESPAFVVYSETALLVMVPDVLADARITEIVVLSSQPSMTQQSLVELGVGARLTSIEGRMRLIQNFVRLLMRTTGSNIFHPTTGGSLPRMIGKNIAPRLTADVTLAITEVRRQIVEAQSAHTGIPASERLLSAEVAAVQEDPANAQVNVTVVVTAHDRQRSAATLIA